MKPLYFVFAVLIAMVGNVLNDGAVFLVICDFLFWPWVLAKWIIFHEVDIRIVHQAFIWFF